MAGFATLLSAAAPAAGLTNAASFGLMELVGGGTAAGFNAATAAGAAGTAASIGSLFNLAGHGTAAAGTIVSGQQAKTSSRAEAKELERMAAEERAAAQRKAMEKRRQTNLLLSRSQAVSAASGGGATDPTVLALEGGIAKEGEYQADVETYLGESRARGLQAKASNSIAEGNAAYTSSLFKGGGTILSGISSYYDRYGRNPGASSLRYG